ncbi:STAS domain-containing protein [Gallaecimonas mangrovi]|uniref:STAS domain-containing protein n=1 Tax=Gallaecimonas mangrovi TaxID=2291597 RepID=UPI000E200787|nr:STAS domain-containing protein [Gallaecimonas mangrovi]
MEKLSLPQRLTVAQIAELWEQWKGYEKQEVTLQAQDVHQVDVAGLQLLLKLKLANHLSWESPSEALTQAAALAGVDSLLSLPSVQEGA